MELEPHEDQSRVARYLTDVGYGLAVDVGKKALTYCGLTLVGLLGLLIWTGGSVPAWILVPVVITAGAVPALWLRRKLCRDRDAARAQLAHANDELTAAEETVDIFSAALVRHETYSAHVAEALDALQRIVSGDIEVSTSAFIETGVLEPARDLIQDKPAEHVRLSVLLPRPGRERWFMPFAAGHSVTGKAKYEVPISESLSRHAFETAQSQHWPDVATEGAFRQNPLASHNTRSMISLPLRWGDQIVGVFNVISSEPHAFDPAEETYIEALGGVIAVAVGMDLARKMNGQASGSE